MKAVLEAMVLETKPEANKWLHLTPGIAALGITKIHAYLVRESKLAENVEEKSTEFGEAFWTQNVRGEEGFERTDSMLEGLGKNLPVTLSLSDKGIPQSSYGIIYRRDPRTLCDVWSRIFCERTSSAAHCRNTEPPTGWTPDINCDLI